VVEVLTLLDRLQPRQQQVADDLVRRLEQHDAAVVARQREVALFGQDAQQADLPLDGHLLGRPEVLHQVLHEREAGVG